MENSGFEKKTADGVFTHGSQWVRADFHLHTKADKEFSYNGEETKFTTDYVDSLENAGIRLGVITNHNKFDVGEFKALRVRARKRGIGLLPGIELSVNDGSNGVHTLVVFSDEWLEDGKDYINQFLNVAFAGKTPDQYEQENGRSNDDLLTTLKKLEDYHRDFFIVFAHVESSSGLWKEVAGGRMQELAKDPLIQRYCRGFQKVRTHDKPDKVCRTKVKQWWQETYPAEVEGCDAKKLDEIGRGKKVYLKIGDFSFDAVKYALTDHMFRVSPNEAPVAKHSHINSIRFEGGCFDEKRVTFSPHLNCLIGIQGSGKSSVLECLRYALDIPFGDEAQDKDYKNNLVPYVLKSGGKVVVEATDRHGTQYEISRILGHSPDVYVDGELQTVSIRDTIIKKPLYFGQKDLAAQGKQFGHDLVEKLVGEELRTQREIIAGRKLELEAAVDSLLSVQSDADQLAACEAELQDLDFRLEQFDKHGVKEKLEKQVEFGKDFAFCDEVDEAASDWRTALQGSIEDAEEAFSDLEAHATKYNKDLFKKYNAQVKTLKASVDDAKKVVSSIDGTIGAFAKLRGELNETKNGLKEEFAEVERDLVKALEDEGVTSIQPDAYILLTERKTELLTEIADLKKRTSKQSQKSADVLKAVKGLNDAWHDEFKAIAGALDKINKAQGALQIKANFKGDKEVFRSKMEETFRGNNIRKDSYQALSEKYADFAEIYKDLDKAKAHAKGKAETLVELFIDNLKELLGFQIPNSYDMTYHGKPLRSHSLGQRASAMMLFLLSQDDNDVLLIDQPEDDLDSQTVYEEVVKLLRSIKDGQQFIFATHNANFPVLGDAEIVSSCSAEGEIFAVETGSIDSKDCQERIISIMEGGPEAFERRKTIYQIWRGSPAAS
ncbi:TrlF family AAA-like ATPase [Hyphomonas sp. UBA3201]|uniref:TrlF family AAA-like ATPase n=1 Tax=Hyphomonas sp. UBA3201 TaxID=1946623 RepID=UPI0032E4D7E4